MTQLERIAALEAKIERLALVEENFRRLEKDYANLNARCMRVCTYIDTQFDRCNQNFKELSRNGSLF